MNNVFTGGARRQERTYDYSGIWSRAAGRISWKAVVRSEDVVCRPSGSLDEELPNDDVILAVVKLLIESSLDDTLAAASLP